MICFYYSIFLFCSFFDVFFFSLYFLYLDYCFIFEWVFFMLNSCNVSMLILFDWVSLLFLGFVFFISSMVIYYSDGYMEGDLNLNRFVTLIMLFVISMMFLIVSPNLISILLGWDGLGLVSYGLVIYYQNVKSGSAGMLTALSNRVGDVAILISISWMFNYGDWSFYFWIDCFFNDYYMKVISCLIVLASLTKSAQIPFSAWLPAAMAAPTPVSALVHSSTLVTAGVYLLIRFNECFSLNLKFLLLFISIFTMFMAGLGANLEFDLKKIIALSTLSQLGLMISVLALGGWDLCFFHLLTHALFKALLFMCGGLLIHNLGGCQDIRFMGGMLISFPMTCSLFLVSNLSLCGLPFFSGFYSKDLMMEICSMSFIGFVVCIFFFISIGLTVSYTFRLIYYLLVGEYNYFGFCSFNEVESKMMSGMMGLIFLVVFMGSLLSWIIFPIPYFVCLPYMMKFMALVFVVLGSYLGYEFSKFFLNYNLLLFNKMFIGTFFSSMWNMPYIFTFGVNHSPLYLGSFFFLSLDVGWLEYTGGKNLYFSMKSISSVYQFLILNSFKVFMLMFIFLVCVLLVM
uniref:NADH-ubiquinone oxidoreductase chain 5 n=1 Tax=Trinodes hirtus TaxID=442100 RepID=S4SVY1_9COLE|nr:NADH dehydrogenase subunit 5 [Trinodes hirtus]